MYCKNLQYNRYKWDYNFLIAKIRGVIMQDLKKLQDGTFYCGVNYWASHVSLKMWQNWDAAVVEKDFQALSNAGIKILRVFPLWSDFQPLKSLLGWGSEIREIRYEDSYASEDRKLNCEEQLNKKCMDEFTQLCDLAKKYNFQLIVPLITGYMSGRNFFPDAFVGRNVITDPLCIKYEVKYVQAFVDEFKNRDEIIAWELGNECNCMAKIDNAYQAWLWTNTIVSAIKLKDKTRPVISGMHGLCCGGAWNLDTQETCDMLTVHPYPLFTAGCAADGLISSRAITHSVAEQTMYSDLTGKPCLIEEIGTLGEIYGDEETAADFIRANLWNGWANNGLGLIWWDAFDQDFSYAPYEWVDCERALGMFKAGHKPKLLVDECIKFDDFLRKFPYEKMPIRLRNAVCLVSSDAWLNGFGSYMLAKRAGIELKFADISKTIPDGEFYVIPARDSVEYLPRTQMKELINKIENGATVLMTYDGGSIAEFEKLTGCRSKGRMKVGGLKVEIAGQELQVSRDFALKLMVDTAEILLVDKDGEPALTCNRLGKGKVLFFNAPLERFFATTAGIGDETIPYEQIYAMAFEQSTAKQVVRKQNANTYITVHQMSSKSLLVVAINNTTCDICEKFDIEGYKITDVYYGDLNKISGKSLLRRCDAVVFKIEKK